MYRTNEQRASKRPGVGRVIRWIVTILLLLLVVALVLFAVWPVPVKPVLKRIFPTPLYQVSESVTRTTRYSAFYGDAAAPKPGLVAVFVGGSFLLSNLTTHYGFANELYGRVRDTHDVLLIAYPTRFRYTLRDMLLSINLSLSEYDPSRYRTRHFVGFSAGALLAGTFEHKERDAKFSNEIGVPQIGARVTSFAAICGLLKASFNVKLYDALYEFYIARGTPSWQRYSCYGMQIPRLVVTSGNDLLNEQALEFLATETAEELVFRENLPHTFAQNVSLPQAMKVVERVADFVLRAEKTATS